MQLIEDVASEKEACIRAQEFDRAAALRDREKDLRREYYTLRRALRENPKFGLDLEGKLDGLALPLPWPDGPCVRQDLVTRVTDLLAQHRPVLLIGPPGSGRSTVAAFVGRALAIGRVPSEPMPRQVLLTNHLALRRASAGATYGDLLTKLAADIYERHASLLAIPDLHLCCAGASSDFGISDAWKQTLEYVVCGRLGCLAWTTETGYKQLRSAWPGLIGRVESLRLSQLTREALRTILHFHLARLTRESSIRFETDLADSLLDLAPSAALRPTLAPPGRLLCILGDAIELARQGAAKAPSGPAELEIVNQRRTLQAALTRAVALQSFEEAHDLIERLKALGGPVQTPRPMPPDVLVTRDTISAVLRRTA
jgi:hypothetical protein